MKTFAKTTPRPHRAGPDGHLQGAKPLPFPLSRVEAGTSVRIKQLSAPPRVTQRLREIGFGEEQVVRLLIRQTNLICLVCNSRLALSSHLAQMILVEPLPPGNGHHIPLSNSTSSCL